MLPATILLDQLTLRIIDGLLWGTVRLNRTNLCEQEMDAAVIMDAVLEKTGGTYVYNRDWQTSLRSSRVIDWSVWHQLRYSHDQQNRFDPLFLFLDRLELLPPLWGPESGG